MELTFAERLSHMATGTVIGILTVFAILIFLWGLLVVMQLIFSRKSQPKPKTEEQEAQVAAVQAQDDGQLVAVITAAVACMLEAQGVQTAFKVKSFRRTN